MIRFLLAFLLFATPAFAMSAIACTVQKRAEVLVTLIGGQPLVAARVDGKPVTLLVDTGAEKSLLSDDTMRRLGLKQDEWVSSHMQGIGGADYRPNAKLTSLELGGIQLHRRGSDIANTIAVAPLPFVSVTGRAIDGLLGLDFLSVFDVSFDLRRGMMSLYDVQGCSGNFLPWTAPYDAIAAEMIVPQKLFLPASIGERKLRALIDSGSTRSVLSLVAATRLGVTKAMLARDQSQPVHGMGGGPVTAWDHKFPGLRVGGTDPGIGSLFVMALPAQGMDLLLGMDWLGKQPVWMSWATNQVFVGR